MKNLILLLPLSFLFSCSDCIQTNLTGTDKEWVSAYKNGDVVIFESNLGHLDTLTVIEKQESYTNPDCNRLGVGKTQQHFITVKLEPKTCNNRSYCEVLIDIRKESENAKAIPFFRIFGLEFSKTPDFKNAKLITERFKTKNKVYDSAYYFKENLNSRAYGLNHPKSFHYDKKDGLIQYESKSGELFQLLKKIKK